MRTTQTMLTLTYLAVVAFLVFLVCTVNVSSATAGGASANSPLGEGDARTAFAGGRITLVGATEVSYAAHNGASIEVGGEMVVITDLSTNDRTSENLLSAAGGDSGVLSGTSQALYAYVSNANVTYSPRALRLSLTAPSPHRDALYLATSGVGANWRCVGRVGTDTAGDYRDDQTARLVLNYYNSRMLPFETQLRNDNNAESTISLTTVNHARLNAGTGDGVLVIVDGAFPQDVNVIQATAIGTVIAGGASVAHLGIAVDAVTNIVRACKFPSSAVNESASCSCTIPTLADGVHELILTGATGGVATTFASDFARLGSTADPIGTALSGFIIG